MIIILILVFNPRDLYFLGVLKKIIIIIIIIIIQAAISKANK